MPRNNAFLVHNGISYMVERNNSIIGEYKGLISTQQSTGRRYVAFLPETDIQPNDWLINPSGDRFYVNDKETTTFARMPHRLNCYVESEVQHNQQNSSSSPVTFNIGNANSSAIGVQPVVSINYNESIENLRQLISDTNSPDKEELSKITDLLQMMIDNQLPPQKGMLSKFSGVMERNSWITGSIASTLINWLTTQIH